ncbi:unnamed protein product [Schistosoma mattheei]|uniref:Large ribosomal subunit protein uL24 C-terminal domain-containing protein n=1 Tax=Schistosoma mattheei TaxID=31246 RepID=A0AA85B4Y9_9TREM|nr:unnamed protein product [Schistosoma mattheei]
MSHIQKFNYWPRYVARLIRFRPVYRKELLGWRFETDHMFQRPNPLPNEKKEEKYLPIWHFSEKPPWNVANRLSEFPYPNITWCVIHPNGDRVQILCGPDKGRVGIVSSVLKIRRLVYVDGLNYHIDTQVALLDPSNNEPCKCSWRYTEEGNRVRVSLQTGHVIPLPAAARHLDDLTDPKTAVVSPKDTCEPVVCNVSSSLSLRHQMSISKRVCSKI